MQQPRSDSAFPSLVFNLKSLHQGRRLKLAGPNSLVGGCELVENRRLLPVKSKASATYRDKIAQSVHASLRGYERLSILQSGCSPDRVTG